MTRALSVPALDSDAPVWPVAAAALPIGFAIAQASGVRPVGGAVMVALLAACAWRARGRASVTGQLTVAGVALASFVASHVLADSLTVPGAVGAAGAAVGAAAFALLDRRPAGR
jgi:hypothetical protein